MGGIAMKYYKLNNEVFAFDLDQLDYVKPEMVEMTAEEVDHHINPQKYLTDAEKRAAYLTSFPILSKRKFNLYLFDNGLKDEVDALLSANPRAKIEFDSTDSVERSSPTVEAMISLLGWTDEQVETMWQQALSL